MASRPVWQGVELVHVLGRGKNAVDIRMAIDLVETLYPTTDRYLCSRRGTALYLLSMLSSVRERK